MWRVEVEVERTDAELGGVVGEVHEELLLQILSSDERDQLMAVDLWPVLKRIDYLVGGLLLQVAEGGHAFAVEDDKRGFEVEVREVAHQRDLLAVLVDEMLQAAELAALDPRGPDCV